MIDVNFHGKWSWERRQLFSQAAEYFLSILLPKEYPYLCLDITLMQSKGISGWCTPYDKDYYNIEINKNRDIYTQLVTLAHESVHCKQFYRGELGEKGGITYWKKKPYYDPDIINNPWEIEAYMKEQILLEQFVNLGYHTIIDYIQDADRATRKALQTTCNTST